VTVGNLPALFTSFIGREREIAQVVELLGAVRVLTLVGPGGAGKTRLAIRVATDLQHAFPDGVCFAALAPLRDPALVAPVIAQALAIGESGGQPLLERLSAYLRTKQLLLILDNFEQVLAAAPLLAELLAAAPGVKALVTSRAPLRLSGEQEFPMPPLALPDPHQPEQAAQSEAVQLFVARARSARPDFTLAAANAGPSRRAAGSSTGCRWRSSWPQRGSSCCRRPRCWRGSTAACPC
jgi:predicted ATPase